MTDQIHKIPHLIIAGSGQWGQQAIDHALHRAVLEGGRVTVIVPRRYQHQFETAAPTFAGWAGSPSVATKLAELKSQNRPVHVVYDDHLSHLAAQLIEQRKSGRYFIAGYVATASEEHLPMARYLSRYCDRLLVEKPISTVWEDLQSDGPFIKLAQEAEALGCRMLFADHFLFRPGVSRAQTLSAEISLTGFLKRHAKSELHYEFRFCEPASRDDPNTRLSAYKDGAVGDMVVPHGLPPLLQLVLPELAGEAKAKAIAQNFDANVRNLRVRRWSATSAKRDLHVAILAETAARMDFDLTIDKRTSRVVHVHLVSVKGHSKYDRFFRVYAPLVGCKSPFFRVSGARERARNMLKSIPHRSGGLPDAAYLGVSLGAVGCTVADFLDSRTDMSYQEIEGGHRSDQTRVATSEAANAHASMLDHLLRPELEESAEYRRFMNVRTVCAITRFAIKTLHNASSREFSSYHWGSGIGEDDLEKPLDKRFKITLAGPADPMAARVSKKKIAADAELDNRCRELVKLIRNRKTAPRVVSIIGPEGVGKDHIAKKLKNILANAPYSEYVVNVDIAQYLSWPVSSEETRKFGLDVLFRSLAAKLGFVLPAGKSPLESLKAALLADHEAAAAAVGLTPKPLYLLVTGLSFVPDNHWPDLVSILALLPPDTRLILFTRRNDRACGHIRRVDHFAAHEVAKALIDDCWAIVEDNEKDKSDLKRHLPRIRKLFDAAPTVGDETGMARVRSLIERYSHSNPALMRLYAHMLYYLSLPSILKELDYSEDHHPKVKDEQEEMDQILRRLEQDLASTALPRTLIPNPERQLERVACFMLGELSVQERAALYQLSLVPEPFTRGVIDAVMPSLFDRALQHQPVRIPFEFDRAKSIQDPNAPMRLFPEIRRVSREMSEQAILGVHAEVTRGRLLLRRHIQTISAVATPAPEEAASMVEAFIRLDLARVDLSGGAFAQLLRALVQPIYALHGATGNEPAMGLIVRLTRMEDDWATNTSLLGISRLSYLYAQAIDRAAGANWTEANRGIRYFKRAYWIAERACEIEAKTSALCFADGFSDRHHTTLRPEEARLLALQGWCFARLRQAGCFRRLFGVRPVAAPQDADWDRGGKKAWRDLTPRNLRGQTFSHAEDKLAAALAQRTYAFELLVNSYDAKKRQRMILKAESLKRIRSSIDLLHERDRKLKARFVIENALVARYSSSGPCRALKQCLKDFDNAVHDQHLKAFLGLTVAVLETRSPKEAKLKSLHAVAVRSADMEIADIINRLIDA